MVVETIRPAGAGPRRAARGLVLLALVALSVPLGVLAVAAPAWAHAALTATAPAPGASVGEPVEAVTLTFTDPVKQQFTTVIVSAAPAGGGVTSFSEGAARAVDAQVIQKVRPLPAGLVRVAWRTVALDGHPLEGAFSFTVAVGVAASPSAGPAAPSAGATTAVPASPVAPPRAARTGSTAVRTAIATAIAAAGSLAGLAVWRRRRNRAR